ncbi:hypothetical protein J4433_01810 [Candidatus Pacearchaeota archaeon]|nr:hypothetical protein [Candidatus Pacearchaeota archaeon]
MKRICLVLAALLAVFSLLPLNYAFEIKTSKMSYLTGETFLAEVNAEFIEQLAAKNIFFYKNNQEIEPAFYILQASKQQYFIWVNLQDTGNYSFVIKNMLYKENGVLKGDEKGVEFEVEPSINVLYQSLIQTVKSKWPSSIDENALSLMALSYDDALVSAGRAVLMSKSKDGGECWPKASCNVKETSLAIMALDKMNIAVKTEWLVDSQNNLDLGLWNLQINSASQQECKLLINTESQTLNLSQSTNTIELDLKSKPETASIKVNCSIVSGKIIHTYLGRITEFPMQIQSNEAGIELNNKKCFGAGYRSECDSESTAYAVLALKSIDAEKTKAVEWLKKNAQTTKEKSIVLYLSSSSDIENWLVNNQHSSGYSSSKSLLESQQADFESTVFAALALKKEKKTAEYGKAETWLKDNFVNANLKDKALAAAYIFIASGIEPIITINPAALKAKTNTTINTVISNKAVLPVNITAEFLPFKTKQTLSIKAGSSEKLTFEVPIKIGRQEIINDTPGSINLEGKTSLLAENSYSIPVIILATENETANETIEIPAWHFKFSTDSIKATILAGDETLMPLTLRDLSHYVIRDISITYSRDLKDIINITPTSMAFINPGEEAGINLTFKSGKIRNISGFIEARAASPVEISAMLPVEISFTTNATAVSIKINTTEEEKTCREMNGTVCKGKLVCTKTTKAKDNDRCCIGTCKSGINMTRIVGILLITIAVIILAVFVMIGLKKPKKQSRDIYSDIEKKYSKPSRIIEPKG